MGGIIGEMQVLFAIIVFSNFLESFRLESKAIAVVHCCHRDLE